jgi:hypothetical protein
MSVEIGNRVFVPQLQVILKDKMAPRPCQAGWLTRVGLFVATSDPKPERQVVQLQLDFGDGARPTVMAHVVRAVRPESATPESPAGMELRFFSLPEADRERYNRLVEGPVKAIRRASIPPVIEGPRSAMKLPTAAATGGAASLSAPEARNTGAIPLPSRPASAPAASGPISGEMPRLPRPPTASPSSMALPLDAQPGTGELPRPPRQPTASPSLATVPLDGIPATGELPKPPRPPSMTPSGTLPLASVPPPGELPRPPRPAVSGRIPLPAGAAPTASTAKIPLGSAPLGSTPAGASASVPGPLGSVPPRESNAAIDIRWTENRNPAAPPPPASAQARAFPRRETSFRVKLKDMIGGEQEGATRDVSLGGMFLKTPDVKAVGERFAVEVVHPFTGVRYALSCTVRRIEKDALGHPMGMGVQFDPLNAEERERFTLFTYSGFDLNVRGGETALEAALEQVLMLEGQLRLHPSQPESHYHLGLLWMFMMDLGKARSHLELARSLGQPVIRDVWERLHEEEEAMRQRIHGAADELVIDDLEG